MAIQTLNNRPIVQARASLRNNAARKIRELRAAFFRELDSEQRIRLASSLKAGCTYYLKDVPPNPTKQNIYNEMISHMKFSKTSRVNHGDTEYYSACGIDDYHCELRHDSYLHARDLFREWQNMQA